MTAPHRLGLLGSRRWFVLLAIGASITLFDQASKFLAVKHLTPGLQETHGLVDQVSRFYGSVEHPCHGQPVSGQASAPVSALRCPAVSAIDGFWNWRYVENPGAVWGFLSRADESVRVPFFLLVSIGALFFIFSLFKKLTDDQHLMITALSLVFGGAIGNFIDRLHLSYVIDFIDWYVGSAHWPTFNIADSAICCGVGLLVLEWIRDTIRSRATKPAPEESSA